MSTESNPNSSNDALTQRIAIVPLLFAIVLGASLIEFNEFLFPPKLTSLSFWALFAVYFTAFLSWFGWHEAVHLYPYTLSPIVKLRALIEAMVVVSYANLLYFASRADESLTGYLWGFVIVYIILMLVGFVRHREYRRPEAQYNPLDLNAKHGLIVVAASIAYTTWSLRFPPVPYAANWVFVFVPFAVTVSYRWLLARRLQRPMFGEKDIKVETPESGDK